jgi:hypothetical protein
LLHEVIASSYCERKLVPEPESLNRLKPLWLLGFELSGSENAPKNAPKDNSTLHVGIRCIARAAAVMMAETVENISKWGQTGMSMQVCRNFPSKIIGGTLSFSTIY